MILALDSYYKDDICNTSLVVFEDVNSDKPLYTDTIYTDITSDYIPGEFYKRELPGIIKILEKLKWQKLDIWNNITLIITDSFITLKNDDNEWDGLGAYLDKYLKSNGENKTICGVAKSNFGYSHLISKNVYRGDSSKPLYVQASRHIKSVSWFIKNMHGKYRIPTMLKLVDQLSRVFPDNKG